MLCFLLSDYFELITAREEKVIEEAEEEAEVEEETRARRKRKENVKEAEVKEEAEILPLRQRVGLTFLQNSLFNQYFFYFMIWKYMKTFIWKCFDSVSIFYRRWVLPMTINKLSQKCRGFTVPPN